MVGEAGGEAPAPYKGIGRRSRGIVVFGGCGGRSLPTEGVQGGDRRGFSVFACPGPVALASAAVAPLRAGASFGPGVGDNGSGCRRVLKARCSSSCFSLSWDERDRVAESVLTRCLTTHHALNYAPQTPLVSNYAPQTPPFSHRFTSWLELRPSNPASRGLTPSKPRPSSINALQTPLAGSITPLKPRSRGQGVELRPSNPARLGPPTLRGAAPQRCFR